MPPRKKRRPSAGDDMAAKKSRQDSVFRKHETPQIREEETFSSKRCLEWFYEYAGCDDVVGPEGMEKFCEDIGVEPENVVMLVLAWKLDAQSMGYFTLQEWLRGMGLLQCDSTERLRNSLDYLRSVLNDSTSFKLIYRYAFDFAREKDQRSLDLNTAKCMLGLLLGKTWPLFPVFNQFLEQSKYKVINKDQWCNVLEFSRTINLDLSNYDEDGACKASFVGRVCGMVQGKTDVIDKIWCLPTLVSYCSVETSMSVISASLSLLEEDEYAADHSMLGWRYLHVVTNLQRARKKIQEVLLGPLLFQLSRHQLSAEQSPLQADETWLNRVWDVFKFYFVCAACFNAFPAISLVRLETFSILLSLSCFTFNHCIIIVAFQI
ncbi:hypothetical protein FQN60_013157, partial [Etheostoma spectabile]